MTITSRQRTAGGGNGVHRQLQRPLLARRHSGGGPRALFRLAARDLRRCASGTARDRSLRARLSRRAALALRAQRALSQFLRHLRPSRDRADQAALGGRAARRHPDLLLHPGYPSPESAAGRGVDAPPSFPPMATASITNFVPSLPTSSSSSSAPASFRARRCSRICRYSACKA
jgi:hypothetical protein